MTLYVVHREIIQSAAQVTLLSQFLAQVGGKGTTAEALEGAGFTLRKLLNDRRPWMADIDVRSGYRHTGQNNK
jgi:hypothetical protein